MLGGGRPCRQPDRSTGLVGLRRRLLRARFHRGATTNVFTLCGSTVNGSVGVVAAMGPVTMAPVSTGCGANTVTSSIASLISSAGVNITANQVGQKLLVWDARGPAASIAANHVGGDLWCANDVPVPNNAGQPNVVTGSRIGQCGAASF